MPVTTVATDPDVRRLSARRGRYEAQRVLWRETKLQRVAYCGRIVSDRAAGVGIKVSGRVGTGDARAGFSGLQTCGSVWACPVCSEKINAHRQQELDEGICRWLAGGGAVLFGTLTLRHNRGHRLAELWDAIGPAWNRTTSGAGVAWNGGRSELGDRSRFGIRGYVRVVEVKHGENGWHPHVHFLLFLDRELPEKSVRDLEGRMFGRWETALAKRGLSVIQSVGIDLRPVVAGDGLADYFTKATYSTPGAAAYEVTGSHSKQRGKGGRTPFQILADVVAIGDADDLDLWHEWEQASKRRRQLTWSRGLRALLALDQELTDEEVAEQELDGDVVWTFTPEEWKAGHWPLLRVELLEAAEAGFLAAYIADAVKHRRWGDPPS